MLHRCLLCMLGLVISSMALADTPLTTVRVASGLNRPVYATAAPGDPSRLFILEKRGVIRILELGTNTLLPTPFLDIQSLVTGSVSNGDERGLLGMAFDPDYANNGKFYVHYTRTSGSLQNAIASYQVSGNPNIANASSAQILLTINQPRGNHNGGWIGFSPNDGYLYISIGDGGSRCDLAALSGQDLNQLLGKILRLDVASGNAIAPASNPFVSLPGRDEIWAYGLRNAWRCSFDRVTGDLYIADVGQDVIEEVNFQSGNSLGGENYGWNCMEGTSCSSVSSCSPVTCTCNDPNLILPVHEYTHGGNPFRCSITGGYVYRGCAIPDLRGAYFFADYCSEQIWTFRYINGVTDFQNRTAAIAPAVGNIDEIVSVAEDTNGELYFIDQSTNSSGTNGEIYKLIPAALADAPTANDYDNDGDVDTADQQNFFNCLMGPDQGLSPCLCDVFDEDSDSDADMAAAASFQSAFSG